MSFMYNLPSWKLKIIKWLAADEPVLLNLSILPEKLPKEMYMVWLPPDGERNTAEFYAKKAFLVPTRNITK